MGTPNGARRWSRTAIAVAAAVLVIVSSAAIAYRVLAPAEVVTPARTGYPPAATVRPGVVGILNAAPLIVDDRLRVYATTRQVHADQPVGAKTRRTPYWSFRRWPAEVAGLLAAGSTVVTRWSDGELVALDARTGRVDWRAGGPRPDQGYAGRRTGAATVYAPAGLYTSSTADGRQVLVVTGDTERRGIDLFSGRELWRVAVDRACRADGPAEGSIEGPTDGPADGPAGETADGPADGPARATADGPAGAPADGPIGGPADGSARGPADEPADGLTTAGGWFATVDTCAVPQAVEFHDVATGALAGRWRPDDAGPAVEIAPVGCAAGRSGCPAIRTTSDGVTRGWLVDGADPVAAPPLDGPETVLVGDVAVRPEGTELAARSVRTGAELWHSTGVGPARILAVQPGRVHLRTEAGELLTLDSATGEERSRFPFTYGRDSTDWAPGFTYAASGFVAVERLAEPVDPAAGDRRYYLAARPVILAAT